MEGGKGPIHNFSHYYLGGKENAYAMDIVKLYSWGGRAKGIYPKDLKKYAIYGECVYSPCDGVVIKADGNNPEIPPTLLADSESRANYVLIRYNEDYIIMLAHLRQGSILVNVGDKIAKGQPVGQIGNSGSTVEPHLHIDVQKSEINSSVNEKKYYSVPYPFSFGGRFYYTNSIIEN